MIENKKKSNIENVGVDVVEIKRFKNKIFSDTIIPPNNFPF